MKLQLLIPQYNETEDVIRPMLDSIRTQQGVDLKDIEVLIGMTDRILSCRRSSSAAFLFPSVMKSSIIPACREPVAACLTWRLRIM